MQKKSKLAALLAVFAAILISGAVITIAIEKPFQKKLPNSELRAEVEKEVLLKHDNNTVALSYTESTKEPDGSYNDWYQSESGDTYVLNQDGNVVGYVRAQNNPVAKSESAEPKVYEISKQYSGERPAENIISEREAVNIMCREMERNLGAPPDDIFTLELSRYSDKDYHYIISAGTFYGKDHCIMNAQNTIIIESDGTVSIRYSKENRACCIHVLQHALFILFFLY